MSIGIAVFPQHAEDADALTRRADVAMYAAKRARSGYSVYSADQEGGENGDRVPLIGKLRYAIDQFELLLHYQPIVSTADGHPSKVEALVRWGHPSHGLLPPDDFIPSAEQTDLIKPLTAWVLNEALGQVHAWSKAGIDIGVSVNLSARNLLDDELPDAVAQLLRTWQVAPQLLSLEITERTIIAVEAEETLKRLHAIGVQISVDDFGTGYSSLTYLTRLPSREVEHVARLARLGITPDEVLKYRDQLRNILHHIEALNRADTSKVPATAHPLEERNVMREDRREPCLPADAALRNAPSREDS